MAMISFGSRKKDGKYVCQDCGMLIDDLLPHANSCDKSISHDEAMIKWSNYDKTLIPPEWDSNFTPLPIISNHKP